MVLANPFLYFTKTPVFILKSSVLRARPNWQRNCASSRLARRCQLASQGGRLPSCHLSLEARAPPRQVLQPSEDIPPVWWDPPIRVWVWPGRCRPRARLCRINSKSAQFCNCTQNEEFYGHGFFPAERTHFFRASIKNWRTHFWPQNCGHEFYGHEDFSEI